MSASSVVEGRDIPLLAIRNSGLVGRLEVQFREHCGECPVMHRLCHLLILLVNDTHPDTTHTLRIDRPFPALKKYARSLDMDKMDSTEHSHVPWAILLVKASLDWQTSVGLYNWKLESAVLISTAQWPGASRSRWS